jgi:prepilin-type N-terminal cleavage/methylation domain-containing protein
MRRRPSGFTLVEIMVAVAITGLLASVSIPTYERIQLRSRQAERSAMLESVRRAVEEYYVRQGRLPLDNGDGTSTLSLQPNPNATVTPQKRPFRLTSAPGDHWADLSLMVEGGVYYVYWGAGQLDSPSRDYTINAEGDLDGDSATNTISRRFLYVSDALQYPPGVHRAGNWSSETEVPADGSTF